MTDTSTMTLEMAESIVGDQPTDMLKSLVNLYEEYGEISFDTYQAALIILQQRGRC